MYGSCPGRRRPGGRGWLSSHREEPMKRGHLVTQEDAVPQTVLFIHIPKTGGSTLRWVLDRQYSTFLYLIPQWFHGKHQTPLAAANAGRMPPQALGAHRSFDGSWPQGQAMAMVRDPVRRVISHMAHLKAEPLAWLPEIPAEIELPLADWCERSPLALFDNNQVRYLSGAREFDGMPLTRAMDETDLELALEAARSRVLVAPMESFDEALLDWGHRLGWNTPYYRRVNVRRGTKPQLPSRDLQALESWNRLDRILCEEVGVPDWPTSSRKAAEIWRISSGLFARTTRGSQQRPGSSGIRYDEDCDIPFGPRAWSREP